MSTERNLEAVHRLIEVGFSQGDVSVVREVVAADCIEHQRSLKPGAAGTEEAIRTLHEWFSDFELVIEEITAAGDLVWLRNRARGTNSGSIMGHPPTGRSMETDVIDVVRMEDGMIVEHWGVPDQLGLLLQLGLMPKREPAAMS